MQELNQAFLPKGKQYRVFGLARPGEDPYRVLKDPAAEIHGRFTFGFSANAMNTSKQALQEALMQLMGVLISPLALKLGIVDADGAYNMFRDFAKSLGQDPDKYLSPPTPESNLPKLNAWDVINTILSGNLPECQPLEDAQTHMATLMDFVQTPEFGLFTPEQVDIFKAYLKLTVQRVAAEQRKAQLVAAAGSQGGMGAAEGIPGPRPGPAAREAPTMMGPGELANEQLPGAGGGAHGPGMMQ